MGRSPPLALALILFGLAGCRTPKPLPPRAAPAPPAPVVVEPTAPAGVETPGRAPATEAAPPHAPPAIVAPTAPARSLRVTPLRDGVWLHTSSDARAGAEANGLVVEEQGRLVLVDLPSSEENTLALLEWVQAELREPIARAILTHAGQDRLAGTPLLLQHGIPLVALAPTCARAAALGRPRPTSLGDLPPGRSIRVGSIELFHPGPAREFHQAIVWLRDSRVLFAGCAVRAVAATNLGRASPEDLQAWPTAIRRILQRYPDATVVVPGHGAPGGQELLHHTLRLLATSTR